MIVTPQHLKAIGGKAAKPAICKGIADGINKYGASMHLDTPLRIAHFLGQVCLETGRFSTLTENLSYSAKGLRATWPSRFTPKMAKDCARKPQKTANIAYARPKYGNDKPGDGWKYRGRGAKQLTFKVNYRDFYNWARNEFPHCPNFVEHPELVATFPWAFASAVWYWEKKGVWKFADKDDAVGATKRINGGTNGLQHRIAYTNKAKKILGMRNMASVQHKQPKTGDPLLKEYQAKLNRLAALKSMPRLNVGTPDGWMGKKTKASVVAFQTAVKSLEVDGKLGPMTRKSIDRSLAKYEKKVKPTYKHTSLAPPKPAPKPMPAKKTGWRSWFGG